jgi:hypothetical protein
VVIVSSCSEDSPPPIVVDFTVLNASITEADNLVATTDEGLGEGQFIPGSQETLQASIDLAEAVSANAASTQTVVDNANTSLQAAIDVYEASVIVPIDPTNLVGHWQFNEGTGTTVADFSGNSFDGTFKTGRTEWGAGTPVWGTDRYGNANSALTFDEGAWVEVPYNAALNPSAITISVWVNAAEVLENNRFLGLHSWNGYKFQLQSSNNSFFTMASYNDFGGAFDRATDPALVINEWYHLAVTFEKGEMVFYIDGTEQARWDDTPGSPDIVAGHNLAIGVGSSKYADTDANYEIDKIIPVAWGGYFHGSLDELRIYKAVLSPTQIMSIYTLENPS